MSTRAICGVGDVRFDEYRPIHAVQAIDFIMRTLPFDTVVIVIRFARGGVGGVARLGVQVHAADFCPFGGEEEAYCPSEPGGGPCY